MNASTLVRLTVMALVLGAVLIALPHQALASASPPTLSNTGAWPWSNTVTVKVTGVYRQFVFPGIGPLEGSMQCRGAELAAPYNGSYLTQYQGVMTGRWFGLGTQFHTGRCTYEFRDVPVDLGTAYIVVHAGLYGGQGSFMGQDLKAAQAFQVYRPQYGGTLDFGEIEFR